MSIQVERRKKRRRYWYIPVLACVIVAGLVALVSTAITVHKNASLGSAPINMNSLKVTKDENGIDVPEKEIVSGLESDHGALSVDGIYLVDKSGTPIQLKGVSSHGLAWFPEYINYDNFKSLRDNWGVNLIRLSMYTYENGGYCYGGSKENLEALIQDGVQSASYLNMYVIIDWHVLNDQNPNTYKEEAKDFFGRMAKKFATNDNVIYEICNEPNHCSWADIKAYADEVIPEIRKYDSDAVIIVGTPTWSQDVDAVAKNPLKVENQSNVMYACHYYAATHKDSNRKKVMKALKAGTPVFISEFSICDASGDGNIDYASALKWADLIDRYGLSYAYWSMSNKDETCSILKPDCNKLANWGTDDLSECGRYIRDRISGGNYKEPSENPVQEPTTAPVLKISYNFEIKGSWETDGWNYYRVEAKAKNESSFVVSDWETELNLPEDASIDGNPWNCVVTLEDDVLSIHSEDGQSISMGQTLNFGFVFRTKQKVDTVTQN